MKTRKQKLVAIWMKCRSCDEFWCMIHKTHAFECACPSLEWWDEHGIDPYKEGPTLPAVPRYDA